MGASKPGPWTGKALARVIEWQLEHPDGTNDECEAWLKIEQAAGHIRVEGNTSSNSVGKRVTAAESGSATKKVKR
jgi:tRNA nucleotidyltransferase (CCA-adding enzyme)